MSENQEFKPWIMYKKSIRMEEFNSCPWNDINAWTDGIYEATCSTKYGAFKAVSSEGTRASSHIIRESFVDSLNYGFRMYGSALTIELTLPRNAAISPKTLYCEYDSGGIPRGNVMAFRIEGYNIATKTWETLFTHSEKYDGSYIPRATRTFNNDKYYSKFRLYSNVNNPPANYTGTSPSFELFSITSGTIKY